MFQQDLGHGLARRDPAMVGHLVEVAVRRTAHLPVRQAR